jgi:cellulose synthase/poly-beta-1,6-N-acetylglucosamine synthase-like glycosyltransferase
VQIIHSIATVLLAMVGIHSLVLTIVYLRNQNKNAATPPPIKGEWPRVVIQLPIYNERHVVDRLVDAMNRLDYPRDRLEVQLLDDSTDETVNIAAAAVERAKATGLTIEHVRREKREGFKAGALAYGLDITTADYVAIFDADFVPNPDFLTKIMPHFVADDRLGMVQTRWAHLNANYSLLTRSAAVALDTHFVIEQTSRHRAGLLMNFSGTAGVWRRETITDAGGWDGDTLSEDIDLSYRAQLRGWRCLYLPEMGTPAEITPLMMGFKKQQARWATGTIQCLRKLGPTVLRSKNLNIWQKTEAIFHLSAYMIHPLMIILLLTTLPIVLHTNYDAMPLTSLGLAMLCPPLEALIAQRKLYPDWWKRLWYFPALMMVGVGIAVSDTEAVLRGLSSTPVAFHRTPKFKVDEKHHINWERSFYTVPVDYSVLIEIGLAFYAAVTAIVAFQHHLGLSVFMMMYSMGFLYVAGLSLWQAGATRFGHARLRRRLELSENKL